MHTEAIKVLKGRVAALFTQATRAQEEVSSLEGGTPGPYRLSRLTAAQGRLAEVQRHIASLEDSIKTLQAARPVHAVSASYAPGMVVKITDPNVFTGEYATVVSVADDGILTLDHEGTHLHIKPSNVIYA